MRVRRPGGLSDQEWDALKRREADARTLTAIAADLVDLAAHMRVNAREPWPRAEVYREAYRLRTQLGRVVARYGAGVPPRLREEVE